MKVTTNETICMIISNYGDEEETFVHQLYPDDEFDTRSFYSWSDLIQKESNCDSFHAKYRIVLPNDMIKTIQLIKDNGVAIYLLHKLASIKQYNNALDATGVTDPDEYWDMSEAYNDTLRHFGTAEVIEACNNSYPEPIRKLMDILEYSASNSRNYEGNPDVNSADIATGSNIRDIRFETII